MHMAGDPNGVRTSAAIAEHAGTNPVVVRRVLGRLRRAGLLYSEKGHAGGWRLAKSPQHITFADVYLALDERLIAPDTGTEEPQCSVEHSLHRTVTGVLDEVERSLIHRLAQTSIAGVSVTT